MKIKQSVINTFKRVGIDYEHISTGHGLDPVMVYNRFGNGSCSTTNFIAYLINWVYRTSDKYERGDNEIKISDFDRIRYFILEQDSNAYMTCID